MELFVPGDFVFFLSMPRGALVFLGPRVFAQSLFAVGMSDGACDMLGLSLGSKEGICDEEGAWDKLGLLLGSITT